MDGSTESWVIIATEQDHSQVDANEVGPMDNLQNSGKRPPSKDGKWAVVGIKGWWVVSRMGGLHQWEEVIRKFWNSTQKQKGESSVEKRTPPRGSNSEILKFYTETKIEIQRQKRTPQADLYGTTSASESWLRRTPLHTG